MMVCMTYCLNVLVKGLASLTKHFPNPLMTFIVPLLQMTIASGSLLLQFLDILILMLEGDKLPCDQLQFGFQSGSSTFMCTWTAMTLLKYDRVSQNTGNNKDYIISAIFNGFLPF